MSIISSNHRLVKVNGTEYSAGSGIVIEDSTISVDPNLSAVIDDKLDTSTFSSYSATIDDELQYVSANAGNTYSAGDNIDIYEQDNDLYISAKDWTTDIANASSYAFNEATAQIPPAFDPTYMSGQIDNKLNKSDFETYSGTVNTQITGLSGEVQTTSSILSAAVDYLSGNAGKTYNGIAPIVVNNTTDEISADTQDITFGTGLDFTNNILSVTAQGADPEVESVVRTNSADWGTITALSSTSSLLDNKITAVRNDLNTVTTNTGYLHTDIQTTSGILSAAIDYVSANVGDEFPASANEAITAYQTYSGTYLTAHQDISNKLDTTAFSTVSGTFLTAHQDLSNYATTGDLDTASSTLSGAIDYISGVAITAHQDLSYISGQVDNKLDTTAFSNVSSTFLTAHQIIPSAKWEEASTEYEQNSGTYLTAHQDISNKLDTTSFSTVSGNFLTAVDLTPYYTTADANTLSSMLSGAIDYVSANAGDEFPASANEAITAYQNASGTYLTAHQPISANEWNSVYDTVETNSGSWAGGTSLTGDAQGAVDEVYSNSADWNSNYSTVNANSSTWNNGGFTGEVYGISGVSPNVDVYIDQNTLWISAAAGGGGDVEVNDYVYNNSATIDEVNTTVQSNSARWAGGGTSLTGDAQGAVDEVYTNSGIWLTAHQDLSDYVQISSYNELKQSYDTLSSLFATYSGQWLLPNEGITVPMTEVTFSTGTPFNKDEICWYIPIDYFHEASANGLSGWISATTNNSPWDDIYINFENIDYVNKSVSSVEVVDNTRIWYITNNDLIYLAEQAEQRGIFDDPVSYPSACIHPPDFNYYDVIEFSAGWSANVPPQN